MYNANVVILNRHFLNERYFISYIFVLAATYGNLSKSNLLLMRILFFLYLSLWIASCSSPLKKQESPYNFRSLEFSFTDSDEEVISFRTDSSKFFLISKNDSLRFGILPDSLVSAFVTWQSDILNNPDKYRVINKGEDWAELVIKINTVHDTLFFLRHGEINKKTEQIILSTRRLFGKLESENSGNTLFETRGLIKPKPPRIIPVKF